MPTEAAAARVVSSPPLDEQGIECAPITQVGAHLRRYCPVDDLVSTGRFLVWKLEGSLAHSDCLQGGHMGRSFNSQVALFIGLAIPLRCFG